MLEVLSAVTGESIAVFEEVDFAEGSAKALSHSAWLKRLASQASDYGSFKTTPHWMIIKP